MVDHSNLPDSTETLLERSRTHIVEDRTGVERMITLCGFTGDVAVDAQDVHVEPENRTYRRDYSFVWDEPGVLRYTHTVCGHGGVPVKKDYPCPELIRNVLEEFFEGRVDVVSDHGFNEAHEHD